MIPRSRDGLARWRGSAVRVAASAVREYVRATAYRTSRYDAMANELEHTAQSGREVAAARRLLTIPLVVVSPGEGKGRNAGINAELQLDLATTLSTRACQVIAEDSRHGIGNQPELVIRAIRDVVAAAADDRSLPGC
ncbi:MAG: hypothetical protein WD733_25270 [Bryobacterales bacterium]